MPEYTHTPTHGATVTATLSPTVPPTVSPGVICGQVPGSRRQALQQPGGKDPRRPGVRINKDHGRPCVRVAPGGSAHGSAQVWPGGPVPRPGARSTPKRRRTQRKNKIRIGRGWGWLLYNGLSTHFLNSF